MYLLLKNIHLAMITTSIGLFVLRGALMLARSPRLRTSALQILPHFIDTLLLASGIGLVAVLGTAVLAQAWLQLKLTLILAYIVAGSVALKRGRTYRVRAAAFAAALVIVALIVTTAVSHRPPWPLPPG